MKPALIRTARRLDEPVVDNCKGASGLERGARFLGGETSEGEKPGAVVRRNKLTKLGVARKPLGG